MRLLRPSGHLAQPSCDDIRECRFVRKAALVGLVRLQLEPASRHHQQRHAIVLVDHALELLSELLRPLPQQLEVACGTCGKNDWFSAGCRYKGLLVT